MIASTKNGIDMKCLDSQKPLCETTPSLSFVFIDREQSLMLFYVLLKFVASEPFAQKSVGFKGTHKILDKQSIMILRFKSICCLLSKLAYFENYATPLPFSGLDSIVSAIKILVKLHLIMVPWKAKELLFVQEVISVTL